MAVDNKLKVQGRNSRSEICSYKGEKLNINDSKYVSNDVVSIKDVNDEITFEKYNGTSFESYPEFQLNILDKSFSSESVYYYTLNNAFNTCRIITYNLMDLLKEYSSVNNITLNKDTSINETNICISNSLENFIQYYFYNKYALFGISFVSNVNILPINFKYFYKQSRYSSLTQENGILTFKIIDDDSLYFDYPNNSLKHYSAGNFSNNINYNKEGWNQTGEFPIYTYDKEGHLKTIEIKQIILPKKPYFSKYAFYQGAIKLSGGTKTILDGVPLSTIKSYPFIEIIFSTNGQGTYSDELQESIYIDTNFIVKGETIYFSGACIIIETYVASTSGPYPIDITYVRIKANSIYKRMISVGDLNTPVPNYKTFNYIKYIIGYGITF